LSDLNKTNSFVYQALAGFIHGGHLLYAEVVVG
jgi:hypothetical protein